MLVKIRGKIIKKFIVFNLIALLFVFGLASYKYASKNCLIAGRGCCSHHGGVCGCSGGRSKCCDGTFSPSCQCFRSDVKSIFNIENSL